MTWNRKLGDLGPACHSGRSRLFTLPLLFPPPFFTLSPSLFSARLVIVAGPANFRILPLVAKNFILSHPHRSLPIPANLQNFFFGFESKLPQITTDLYRSSQILTESHTHACNHIVHIVLDTSLYYQNTHKKPKDHHRYSNILTDPTDPSICLTTFEIPTGPHKFP